MAAVWEERGYGVKYVGQEEGAYCATLVVHAVVSSVSSFGVHPRESGRLGKLFLRPLDL
jgi:hypothetical protein